MPLDPYELDRLRDQVAAVHRFRHEAAARAAHPPRLSRDAWRGPAYDMYSGTVDQLSADLGSIADELAQAEQLARTELLHALA